MINMAVPHLGQSGPPIRLGECIVYSVPGIGAPPPLQAGVQASLAINPLQSLHRKLGKAVLYCSRNPSVRGHQERKPSGAGGHSKHRLAKGRGQGALASLM
jgi:hypothetical protein